MRKSVVIWGTLGTLATTVTAAVLLSGGADDEKQVESAAFSQENGSTDDVQIILDAPESAPVPKQDPKDESNPSVDQKPQEPEKKDPKLSTEQKSNKVQEQTPPSPSKTPPQQPKAPAKPPVVAKSPAPGPSASTPAVAKRQNDTNDTNRFRTVTGKPTIRVSSSSRSRRPSHYVPDYALIALLDTKTVNADAGKEGDPPALKITKAACGDAFFPKLAVTLPEKYIKATQNRSLDVLNNFSLGNAEKPVGCQIIKFSRAKHNAGFGYLSETVVKNGNTGFAMYVAGTNAQKREHTVFDIWFLLLNGSGEDWNVTRSYRWHRVQGIKTKESGREVAKQLPFEFKTPEGELMRWSNEDSGYSKEAFERLLAGTGTVFERWDNQSEKYYVGVWFGGQKREDAKPSQHMFYDGSVERNALMFWLGVAQKDTSKLNFLQTVKLTQEGKWVSVKRQCAELASKYYFEMNTGELSKCIKSAVLPFVS